MSLTTLIADTRKAVADDVANAGVVFAAQGTLVGVTEIDVRTGAHTFKVDEPPALGGADVAANPEALGREPSKGTSGGGRRDRCPPCGLAHGRHAPR